MAIKASDYQFPQKSSRLRVGETGIASLSHGGRTFRFRTNPNEFTWTYNLNKRVDQTYGGRVIQLLGTNIDDFSLKAESGGGRWDYTNRMAKFVRDVMIDQRGGEPATFEYTTRGWKFRAYIVSVPFQDSVEEVLRPFEIQMKVQEDVSGLLSRFSLSSELRRLSDGIGFRRGPYNDPRQGGVKTADVIGDHAGALPIDEVVGAVQDFAGIVQPGSVSQFLPNGVGSGLGSGLTNGLPALPGIGNALPGIGR